MNRYFLTLLIILLLFPLNLTAGSIGRAVDQREWSFPRDHGSHIEFKTEWWYFTGHLDSKNGTYGFELTFFRFSGESGTDIDSEWFPEQFYLTHFTVTDEENNSFYKYEKINRDSLGLAGSSSETLNVWNGLYRAKLVGEIIEISVVNPEIELVLSLKPRTGVILNGDYGLSRKGPGSGEASYYYSMPRLLGKGELIINGKKTKITNASVWMDREFFTIPESVNSGWDWFAIQLEDGASLMVYRLRNNKGEMSPYSSGTYVDPAGNTKILGPDQFTLTPLFFWESEDTGIKYPIHWKISIPSLGIDIRSEATMENQELVLEKFLNMSYWEGRSKVTGTHKGRAYMELVGYE